MKIIENLETFFLVNDSTLPSDDSLGISREFLERIYNKLWQSKKL